MSIDLNKEGGQNQSAAPDYSNPNSSQEVREIYRFAYDCKAKNMLDYQVEQSLMNKGLSQQDAALVLNVVNRSVSNRSNYDAQTDNSGGGGGVPRILIYIGILILVNVLSAAFGWGFWIY
jgi:hypothetical protein